MYRISHFDVLRTANTVGLTSALALLVFAVPLFIVGLVNTPQGGALAGIAIVIAIIGIVALVVILPLILWIFTAVLCLLYNFAARRAGGIRVRVDPVHGTTQRATAAGRSTDMPLA